MNRERRTNQGFTLIELIVAIGVLAIVVASAGMVFKISIESYRIAGANTDIMQKLRAITDQLNADLKGLRKDAPLLIWFEQPDPAFPDQRYDQIMFMADGDFQSTQLYDVVGPGFVAPAPTGRPVMGNVARVYYGQAMVFAPTAGFIFPWDQNAEAAADRMLNRRNRMLGRRQHISSADLSLYPFPNAGPPFEIGVFISSFNGPDNDRFEHDRISPADWQALANITGVNNQLALCLHDANRPHIDLQKMTGVHNLLAQGVGSFSIQWAYIRDMDGMQKLSWYPEPDDFAAGTPFGIFFNMPAGVTEAGWQAPEEVGFGAGFFPEALKFTFRLYDSKGILKGGRTFTHIVYLEN